MPDLSVTFYQSIFETAQRGILSSVKTIQVKVKPNSKKSLLEETAEGPWLAHIKSPPVDGKANQELISLLSEHFRCPKGAILIKSGMSSRTKLVQIHI